MHWRLTGRDGDAGVLWIVVDQAGGRARPARPVWATPQGNLAATLLLRTAVRSRPARDARLRRRAGAGDALDAALPAVAIAIGSDRRGQGTGHRFELKWPNDVLATARSSPASCWKRRAPRGRAALADRHRRQCRRPSGRHALSGHLAARIRIARWTPRRCFRISPMPGSSTTEIWAGTGQVSRDPRPLAGRAAGLGGESP